MDRAALEEIIGDNIWKGDLAGNIEAVRYGRARFKAILGGNESIKGFMQSGEDAYVWGYCDGRMFWCVMDWSHGAGEWRCSRG